MKPVLDEVTIIVGGILRQKPRSYWFDLLERTSVPCSSVNYSRYLFDHPQILPNELMTEHDSADIGPLKQHGMMVELSKTPSKLWRNAPVLTASLNRKRR